MYYVQVAHNLNAYMYKVHVAPRSACDASAITYLGRYCTMDCVVLVHVLHTSKVVVRNIECIPAVHMAATDAMHSNEKSFCLPYGICIMWYNSRHVGPTDQRFLLEITTMYVLSTMHTDPGVPVRLPHHRQGPMGCRSLGVNPPASRQEKT